MEYGATIPLHLRNQYSEGSKLASSRDSRNTSLGWHKSANNAGQLSATVEQLSKLAREVAKQKRRIVGGFVPQDVESVLPFNIYPVSNSTATDAQKKLFTDLSLDISDFTFQIASGLVGARSRLTLNQAGYPDVNFPANATGNFEDQILCPCTDASESAFNYPPSAPEPNTGTCVILDNVNPTLIFGIPAGSPFGTVATAYNQVVLNQINGGDPTIPSTAFWAAAFWIEIIDDPLNGIYANLMGRMYGPNPPRSDQVFPTGSNVVIIAKAIRGFDFQSEQVVTEALQIQGGNLINRFPPTLSNNQGLWSVIFSSLPAGKTKWVFYPGDIVIDDTASNDFAPIVGAGTYYTVYCMTGTGPLFVDATDPPHTDAPNWTKCAISTP